MTFNDISTLLNATSSDVAFSDANSTDAIGIKVPIEPTTSGIYVGR